MDEIENKFKINLVFETILEDKRDKNYTYSIAVQEIINNENIEIWKIRSKQEWNLFCWEYECILNLESEVKRMKQKEIKFSNLSIRQLKSLIIESLKLNPKIELQNEINEQIIDLQLPIGVNLQYTYTIVFKKIEMGIESDNINNNYPNKDHNDSISIQLKRNIQFLHLDFNRMKSLISEENGKISNINKEIEMGKIELNNCKNELKSLNEKMKSDFEKIKIEQMQINTTSNIIPNNDNKMNDINNLIYYYSCIKKYRYVYALAFFILIFFFFVYSYQYYYFFNPLKNELEILTVKNKELMDLNTNQNIRFKIILEEHNNKFEVLSSKISLYEIDKKNYDVIFKSKIKEVSEFMKMYEEIKFKVDDFNIRFDELSLTIENEKIDHKNKFQNILDKLDSYNSLQSQVKELNNKFNEEIDKFNSILNDIKSNIISEVLNIEKKIANQNEENGKFMNIISLFEQKINELESLSETKYDVIHENLSTLEEKNLKNISYVKDEYIKDYKDLEQKINIFNEKIDNYEVLLSREINKVFEKHIIPIVISKLVERINNLIDNEIKYDLLIAIEKDKNNRILLANGKKGRSSIKANILDNSNLFSFNKNSLSLNEYNFVVEILEKMNIKLNFVYREYIATKRGFKVNDIIRAIEKKNFLLLIITIDGGERFGIITEKEFEYDKDNYKSYLNMIAIDFNNFNYYIRDLESDTGADRVGHWSTYIEFEIYFPSKYGKFMLRIVDESNINKTDTKGWKSEINFPFNTNTFYKEEFKVLEIEVYSLCK